MAVLKRDRSTSTMQFVDTAYNLDLFTIKCCMKLPKKMTFYIGTELANLANKVHTYCKAANSVFPTNAHELQIRRDYLIKANTALQALIGKVSLLLELECNLSRATLHQWNQLMYEEAKLISGVKKADKKRFKFD